MPRSHRKGRIVTEVFKEPSAQRHIVFGRNVASIVSGRGTEQLPPDRIALFIERFNCHLVFRTDPTVAVAVEECLPGDMLSCFGLRECQSLLSNRNGCSRFHADRHRIVRHIVRGGFTRISADFGHWNVHIRLQMATRTDVEVTTSRFRDICEEICHFQGQTRSRIGFQLDVNASAVLMPFQPSFTLFCIRRRLAVLTCM